MNTNYFDKYPELKAAFETMRSQRQREILDHLKSTDETYASLIQNRVEQSMILRSKLANDIAAFEKYMDFVYAQEIYELEHVYACAFHDAIGALRNLKLLL